MICKREIALILLSTSVWRFGLRRPTRSFLHNPKKVSRKPAAELLFASENTSPWSLAFRQA
jgi:hypothetical protein